LRAAVEFAAHQDVPRVVDRLFENLTDAHSGVLTDFIESHENRVTDRRAEHASKAFVSIRRRFWGRHWRGIVGD
jgi:hypothetical protein